MRFFNTTGPIVAEDHYHVPLLSRLDRDELLGLIAQKRYFVLHAPRQTGKTTALGALLELLNESGRYRCVYVNVEPAQAAREDVRAAIRAILSRIGREAATTLDDRTARDIWPAILEREGPHVALQEVLSEWSVSDPKPLVLLMDEIDALVGDTLVSVLRQLRSGYRDRPRRFPQSVVLCGVRDVRDYRIHASSEKDPVLGGSAFNVKAKSLRLGDFCESEVRALLGQHTEETGQGFAEEAVSEVWRLTQGQPWLVNALAYEVCFEKAGIRDRSVEVGLSAVQEACERLIVRRDTHLDQLIHKLEEPRVQRVIEPLLSGRAMTRSFGLDDLRYVEDLGLVRSTKPVRIANPIYQEVIPRELVYGTEAGLTHEPSWYVGSDGRLRMGELLEVFQSFFREHSEHWLERFQYREAGPQLLLQAFLQRVVNSGGRIEREYGVGRGRLDLGVVWPVGEGGGAGGVREEQRVVIECKVTAGGEKVLREGLAQTLGYMDTWGAEEGHLVVFDRRPGRTWEEKVYRREERCEGRALTVWGM